MQTATNLEQSKRLLELGISEDTADMTIISKLGKTKQNLISTPYIEEKQYPHVAEDFCTPAWSLSALLDDVIPKLIPDGAGEFSYALKIQPNSYPGWTICYYAYSLDKGKFYNSNLDLFAACINLIEQLVKQEYIKTEKV